MADKQQERAVRTRAKVLHAAAEVFDEYGFSGASIKKIMERAGVTQGAMYFHFASKEAMARAVMLEQADDLLLPTQEHGLQQLIDITMYIGHQLQVSSLLRAGVRLAVEQGEFGMRDDTAYQQWAERFAEELYAAKRDGQLLPSVDVRELSQLLVGAYSGTQLFSHIATNREDLPERVAALWRYLLPGIAPAEACASLTVRPWSAETV
ncbi:ScbR family autoregulator-binding transcription factor [Streptomyces sp. CA-111067]|uniref:ScbR family autoregulator-binding transcription factor n=1 Tax=Streptomyces sp. CA-111067 TaxID=3240046 RepID=UPI003D9777CC